MTYFVKQPAKFRRSKKELKLAPVWSFGSEVEAIEFAKSFESCYVDVIHDGKVIFRNYPHPFINKWMSEAEAVVVRETNKAINEARIYNTPRQQRKSI